MRWITKADPELWETRTRTIFAFLPHACVDGYTRWLCFLEVDEMYHPGNWGQCPGWDVLRYRRPA